MSVIITDNLTRTYGARRGIDSVSLRVPEGSLYGFLGPNGAGKTTTIRVMLGFLRPTEGAASVFGLDCWRKSREIKREVGYVPGDLRLPTWLSGRAALSMYGSIRKRDMLTGEGRGRDLADLFELDLAVKVRKMSRGMRQKLGLILAMAHRPRLLVLDEPSSGLDPLMQDRLREHLRAVARAGATVFFSSHTLGEVEALCDRVAIVRAGRIVADSTLDELQREAGHEIEVRWSRPVDPAVLPVGLTLDEQTPALWRGRFTSPIGQLVSFLGDRGAAMDDITIGRPDLETLFRRFYASEPGAEPNHGDTKSTEKRDAE